jgi:hypothetical protein
MRRDVGGIGCGARGRGDYAPHALGRRRGSARGHYDPPARSSLTAGREVCPRLDGAAAQKGPRLRAEGGTKRNAGSAARRRKDAAMARREAPRAGNGT